MVDVFDSSAIFIVPAAVMCLAALYAGVALERWRRRRRRLRRYRRIAAIMEEKRARKRELDIAVQSMFRSTAQGAKGREVGRVRVAGRPSTPFRRPGAA